MSTEAIDQLLISVGQWSGVAFLWSVGLSALVFTLGIVGFSLTARTLRTRMRHTDGSELPLRRRLVGGLERWGKVIILSSRIGVFLLTMTLCILTVTILLNAYLLIPFLPWLVQATVYLVRPAPVRREVLELEPAEFTALTTAVERRFQTLGFHTANVYLSVLRSRSVTVSRVDGDSVDVVLDYGTLSHLPDRLLEGTLENEALNWSFFPETDSRGPRHCALICQAAVSKKSLIPNAFNPNYQVNRVCWRYFLSQKKRLESAALAAVQARLETSEENERLEASRQVDEARRSLLERVRSDDVTPAVFKELAASVWSKIERPTGTESSLLAGSLDRFDGPLSHQLLSAGPGQEKLLPLALQNPVFNRIIKKL
jgi:hypothetical protein